MNQGENYYLPPTYTQRNLSEKSRSLSSKCTTDTNTFSYRNSISFVIFSCTLNSEHTYVEKKYGKEDT